MAGHDGDADGSITYFLPGLPARVTEDDLVSHFEKYGRVNRASVQDKGGKDKCFGYVTMADADSRDRICTDVQEFGEVSVRALLSKESLHAPDVKKIHISPLPHHITADAIREAFSEFGAVLDVHMPKKVQSGERMNYGFVTFGSDESFDAALNAGVVTVDDCEVRTKPSAQSKGEEVMRKGKGKGRDEKGGHGGARGAEDADAGIMRDRKGGFKYFVPGLPDHVVDEDLRQHFGRYGVVIDAAVVTEKGSEVSRGFGYVTMQESENRDRLLNDKHNLGGKDISILLTKDSLAGQVKKVHLSNLREDIHADEIRDVFSQFGQVLDVHTPKDVRSGKRQNFGFVTLGSDEAFHAALRAGSVTVSDCRVKIKPAAQSRGDAGMDMAPERHGHDMGGRGMDRGYDPSQEYGMMSMGCGKGCGKGPGWGPYDSYGGPYGHPMDGKGYGGKDPWAGMGGGMCGCGKGAYGKDMYGCGMYGDPRMGGKGWGPCMGGEGWGPGMDGMGMGCMGGCDPRFGGRDGRGCGGGDMWGGKGGEAMYGRGEMWGGGKGGEMWGDDRPRGSGRGDDYDRRGGHGDSGPRGGCSGRDYEPRGGGREDYGSRGGCGSGDYNPRGGGQGDRGGGYGDHGPQGGRSHGDYAPRGGCGQGDFGPRGGGGHSDYGPSGGGGHGDYGARGGDYGPRGGAGKGDHGRRDGARHDDYNGSRGGPYGR